jgi:hypothetical protein
VFVALTDALLRRRSDEPLTVRASAALSAEHVIEFSLSFDAVLLPEPPIAVCLRTYSEVGRGRALRQSSKAGSSMTSAFAVVAPSCGCSQPARRGGLRGDSGSPCWCSRSGAGPALLRGVERVELELPSSASIDAAQSCCDKGGHAGKSKRGSSQRRHLIGMEACVGAPRRCNSAASHATRA